MNHRFVSFTLCVLVALTTVPLCAAEVDKSNKVNQPTLTEIGLSVSYFVFGSSDVQYAQIEQLILRSDGTATKIIKGDAPPKERGRYSAVVSQLDFQRLGEVLKAQRFSDMKERYPIFYPVYDITTHIVEDGKRRQVITDGWQVPVEMWNVQMAIRGVASTLKWAKDEKESTDATSVQPK